MRLGMGIAALIFGGCLPVTSQFALPNRFSSGGPPRSVAAGDFNGDGRPDLVVSRTDFQTPRSGSLADANRPRVSQGALGVFLGHGDGTFSPVFNTVSDGSGPTHAAVADINGDGRADIIVCGLLRHHLSVLLGKGDGTFNAPLMTLVGSDLLGSPKVGDFNGDGKLDVVLVDAAENPNLESGRIVILLGRGDGTFGAAQSMSIGHGSVAVGVGDWNGDGKPDLAVADDRKACVRVLFGHGDGTFEETSRIDTPYRPVSAVAADFNKDGRLDLIVGTDLGSMIYLGNGDGTFFHTGDYYTSTTRSGWVGDFNNDGHPDFVSARRLFLGNGTGHFTPYLLPSPGYDDAWVIGLDVNSDGWLDVITADHASERINVYMNIGGGGMPLRASP